MIANGTILGVAPMKTSLAVGWAILIAIFTVIRPEVTSGLSFLPRLLLWVLHVSCGMTGIVFASLLIRRTASKNMPILITIGLTGLLGAMLATPAFLLLELIYPESEPDSWLDHVAAQSIWHALFVELTDALPIVLISWYAVNLPVIFNTPLHNPPPPPDQPADPKDDKKAQAKREKIAQLRERIPDAIGDDIVAISSDLHYLNVHTTRGKTLILGSLKEYIDAFGDQGMPTHRSHWVMKRHVERVHIAGDQANCIMSTGLKVPISRSKRKDVKEYFGLSTRISTQGNVATLKRVS